MKAQNSIIELIELFDSIVSKNRSSFSLEELIVLETVKIKLIEIQTQNSQIDKTNKHSIIQALVVELIKILINPKTWNDIKNTF